MGKVSPRAGLTTINSGVEEKYLTRLITLGSWSVTSPRNKIEVYYLHIIERENGAVLHRLNK